MRPEDIRQFLKRQPFEPIRVGLSDGRYVLIRHPDQAVVSDRYLLVGLARVGRSEPMATPDSGEEIAYSAFWFNLLHVVSVEPAEAA